MSDLERMLAEWLEYLDDEEGDKPLPEWAGETGWVQHDNGSLEDWGIYLLRLAHDEIAALKRIYRRIQAADHPMLTLPVEMSVAMAEMTALLTAEEQEDETE